MCALRDIIEDENLKNSINRRYLVNDTSDDHYRVRLKQTAYDINSFNHIVDGNPSAITDGNVIQNYYHFLKFIKDSDVDPKQIYEAITKVEIVEVNLQISDELAIVQTVFEKINSTGKPLSASDLIRNLLLLTQSAREQERLYNTYWVAIEDALKNENISRFSRDYLIMKRFADVQEKRIYKTFKEHFHGGSATNEDILSEMKRLSVPYAWIKFENCPDDEINRSIKMLNILKTEDLYPLYLFILDVMFDTAKPELRKIFTLLTDFMLRFRIVAPSGGGGSLRSSIQELIENLSSGTIDFTYDAIYYELSNSPSPANRFPSDEEFKIQLTTGINTTYARVLLMKIEENETRNIPVPIEKVTVEHLMPQTLSAWWKENLGGDEMSSAIFEKYINCIGNLASVSQGYNSSMSNATWDIKKLSLHDVQFCITSEIPGKYEFWNEQSIVSRNIDVAMRAVNSIISPLNRTRTYRTRDNSEEYAPGIYSVADLSIPMNGSNIVAIHCNNIALECNRWKDLLVCLVKAMNENYPDKLSKIINENRIHKATSTKAYPQKDPIISIVPSYLVDPIKVDGCSYYCEGCISNIRARTYAKQLLDYFDITQEYSIEIM